jgi:hypothetical protein
MRFYLAARYSRREEINLYRKILESLGHVVTSRWLRGNHQMPDLTGEEPLEIYHDKEVQRFALEDLQDIYAADAIVCFTEPPRSTATRGGRHVEFGIALERGMPIFVVGPRENVFYYLDAVHHFLDFDRFRDYLETVKVE